MLATVLTALVALVHVWIVVLEMVLWDHPRGRAVGSRPAGRQDLLRPVQQRDRTADETVDLAYELVERAVAQRPAQPRRDPLLAVLGLPGEDRPGRWLAHGGQGHR